MAVLHKKEEKIQAVLGRLPKKYTDDEFIGMFIKLYSKDWGKIKSAYIKQAQDKEPGTVINMPKPDLYLKQVLEIYLRQNSKPVEEIKAPKAITTAKKPKSDEKSETVVTVKKTAVKKKVATAEKPVEEVKKAKTSIKKVTTDVKAPAKTIKPKASKK